MQAGALPLKPRSSTDTRPEIVRRRVSRYFEQVSRCIETYGGLVEKFAGDAVMAAFGIPIAHADDEDRAMRAAVAMITELFAWNEKRGARGQKPVDMGIGLNTDLIVSGNIGSPKRMDYTVIGDGVNLAARLESACIASTLWYDVLAQIARPTGPKKQLASLAPRELL